MLLLTHVVCCRQMHCLECGQRLWRRAMLASPQPFTLLCSCSPVSTPHRMPLRVSQPTLLGGCLLPHDERQGLCYGHMGLQACVEPL